MKAWDSSSCFGSVADLVGGEGELRSPLAFGHFARAFKAAGRRPALLNTNCWNPVTTGLWPVASSGARPLRVSRVANFSGFATEVLRAGQTNAGRPTTQRSGLLIALCLSLTGCGGYATFTLPPLSGGDPSFTFKFTPDPDPVITRDPFHDALNPSVTGSVNLYSVFDSQWHTALATTSDGVHWKKEGIVLRADPGTYIAGNGSVVSYDAQFWYWYETGAKDRLRISLARSPDAHEWHKEPVPVLETGPVGSWDEKAVADPYAIRNGKYFYMYYLGQDRAVRQRIGVARSTDGIHWEKHLSNPILDMDEDEAGLGEPAVWQYQNSYWMLYTVRDFQENRYLRLARSADGVRWTKLPQQFRGSQPWNAKVICDPTVVVDGERILVWFGGGDVASPDENLHGQIGFATLTK